MKNLPIHKLVSSSALTLSLFASPQLACAEIPAKPAEHARAHEHEATPSKASGLVVPDSIRVEHTELHETLGALVHAGGRTQEAAKALVAVLHPHFVKEEAYALPPLGLLARLSRGEAAPDPTAAIEMTSRLAAELPQMLAEHEQVGAALKTLEAAAEAEHKPEAIAFVHALAAHAKHEEEVMYPAALLVGQYLRLQAARAAK